MTNGYQAAKKGADIMAIGSDSSRASRLFAAASGLVIAGLGLGSLGPGHAHAAAAHTQQNINFILAQLR
jgi:L-asparaginase/Glu-tRNA(Gln) amidotransferase subunit D